MAEVTTSLRGCRELLEVYGDAIAISASIDVIESSLPANPGIAYTHCRGLLETVCKTILADRGIVAPEDVKPNRLMADTLRALRLTPDAFSADPRVEDGVVDIVRGINQMLNGVVALRNSQGIGPHGRDALDGVLSAEYAVVLTNSVDAVASLLYRMHRMQADLEPLQRIRFGQYGAFDDYVDETHNIVVEETPLQASRALFLLDPEAYRQRLMLFLGEPRTEDDEDSFAEGEEVGRS